MIITASYEGQPPDNARRFVAALDELAPDSLSGLRYAVFGCGNRQWVRTYQAVPKRVDQALAAAGATPISERGEGDADGDFFGAFETWSDVLWAALSRGNGDARAPRLRVEVLPAARASVLQQSTTELGQIVENRELVVMGAPGARSKRHIEIALPAGTRYQPGDYLAILPRNPPERIERVLRRFGLAEDTQIVVRPGGDNASPAGAGLALPSGYPIAAGELLAGYLELGQPATPGQIRALAAACACPPERRQLAALAEAPAFLDEIVAKRVSALDLLERFPACALPFAVFLDMLPPLRARQYSISSSPLRDPARCSLTVAVVDAPASSGSGRYRGVASSFLAEQQPGARVAVAVRPASAHFRPPADPATPMILICAGTGLAPFRGFLEHRALEAERGQRPARALLYFGCDHPEVDYLYRDELRAWQEDGIVDMRPTFALAPEGEDVFVQHRLWRERAEFAALVRAGAHVYVCGDGTRLVPAVRDTLERMYAAETGATAEATAAWFNDMEHKRGRYAVDAFA
ncbi:flavodoxin domain-containing protein [Haliangium ochraceum]|uniref:NADPH--hemoprotein reductase n=1 Tax=Haliangium ochraceum (strain DSM 14365 / JCM 11303 / SMP-2) TaxID=502025 RepID=D0LLU0_HALO1|nr:flavodoxin domain-containing protein [Haliangium ochraceum]ACY15118.1 FAD-binding domain protein [Haliangium ochraceum DSM 14365]